MMSKLITTLEETDGIFGCAFCGMFNCTGECHAFTFLDFVGIVTPTVLQTNNVPPKDLTLHTTGKEEDCHSEVEEAFDLDEQKEYAPSRVIKTTADWNDYTDQKKFMNEVKRWAQNKPGDWEETFADAMLKYSELLISHPDKDNAFYMQSIKNQRVKNWEKSQSFGKGKAQHISIDSTEEQDQVGYYDTYSFEYETEFSEAEQRTLEELVEWENSGSENNLSKDNRSLYKKVAKIEKALPEVDRKTVVFVDTSKAIDLRDRIDQTFPVETRTMTQFERLKKSVENRKKWSKPITPGTEENNSYAYSQGSNETDYAVLINNPEWLNAEPDW